MAALFKRKDQTTIAELEEYYATQKKNRTGAAWLMAFLSLIITVAIILALFFGGRWLYRALTDNDNDNRADTAQTDENGVTLPSFDGDLPSQTDTNGATSGDVAIGTDDTQTESEGVVDDGAATTDQPNTGTTAGTQSSDSSELPDTGAGETAIALIAGSGILGYFVARRRYQ